MITACAGAAPHPSAHDHGGGPHVQNAAQVEKWIATSPAWSEIAPGDTAARAAIVGHDASIVYDGILGQINDSLAWEECQRWRGPNLS